MRKSYGFLAVAVFAAGLMQTLAAHADDDNEPFELREIKGRNGKEIYKAAYGRGGRVGFFRDVDADGQQEFALVTEDGKDLVLSVLELDTDEPRLSFPVGENEAAGFYAVNIDDDPELEYIVAFGSKLQDRFKRVAIAFASSLGSLGMNWTVGNYQYYIMVQTGINVDVRHVRAFDDDGSLLWDRDLSADGEDWNNPRFRWVADDPLGQGAMILMSDDEPNTLLGFSAKDGQTVWMRELAGNTRASKRELTPLTDGSRNLPVLFSPGDILVLDPMTGEPVLEKTLERNISTLPSWAIFDTGGGEGFLAYGEDRSELTMISLGSGEPLWTHKAPERIQDVLPLGDRTRLMAVWEEGVEILDARGDLIASPDAPGEIKKKITPVYTDLNHDDTMELLYVSDKKSIVAWRPESNEHLWTGSASSGMLGAANPAGIYESFFDVDGDGWLDVPARKPSGAGVWLSGRTGDALASVGNGSTEPIVGDFDGNGVTEVFWAKKWYDIVPADNRK